MKIVSLNPALTELVCSFGLAEQLVGISGERDFEQRIGRAVPIVTEEGASAESGMLGHLSTVAVDRELLRDLAPDIVLTRFPATVDTTARGGSSSSVTPVQVQEALRAFLGSDSVNLYGFAPTRLDEVYETIETLAVKLGVGAKGRERAQRIKAQLMDWADNFYDRTKNKKVTFLASVDPLRLGGYWIPDLIHLTSAISQERIPGAAHREVTWQEIVDYRPDVIVVAPEGADLRSSMKSFTELSKRKLWDEIPAVKRGEVIFTDGVEHFYEPTSHLTSSMAILLSAIAGFDSGYITERDSFFRLRWMELHRHRL